MPSTAGQTENRLAANFPEPLHQKFGEFHYRRSSQNAVKGKSKSRSTGFRRFIH